MYFTSIRKREDLEIATFISAYCLICDLKNEVRMGQNQRSTVISTAIQNVGRHCILHHSATLTGALETTSFFRT